MPMGKAYPENPPTLVVGSVKVAEEKNKCKECQAWHDDALDWRESEIAKAVIADRIKTGMASIKP